ncbi:DUF4265 domain-containing protein [Myroides odoratimimus]|uniref:DUF4265 domain-containing protein n=1 Tax=Myroides odoratimimus TaxID=76832 RepID=UPI002575969B|nr:DUF4265 domain-containing protein [Myroides odoratimimus]MDM1396570.1 DUF4265 domain-containing protein [Myroides odoratimimus]MDM1451161.1 DUF4265 domain-containing protein [Myroides odoratimimus]MDM1496148.1 DUF4265 domain-containing protein [Myroides odoratimimus]MDM1529932.1 DUF4265 domain-containing protein [Myroides odoratimimus]
MEEQYQQILVRYYSDVLEENTVETFWGKTIDKEKGLYQVDNIPFYGPDFSCDDIIYAEFDETENTLTYRYVATASGNSTVQVIVQKDNYNREDLYNEILYAGTEIEVCSDQYFVINIPSKTDYRNVYAILGALEEEKVIEFAEPLLSPKHSADLRQK